MNSDNDNMNDNSIFLHIILERRNLLQVLLRENKLYQSRTT